MNAKDLAREAKMIPDPTYYSGRDATTSDLDGEKLFIIYTKIREHHGEKSANAFVSMVKSMKELSATAFLTSLEIFEMNKWKFAGKVSTSNIAIKNKENAEATMLQSFAKNFQTGNTQKIRNSFLELIAN